MRCNLFPGGGGGQRNTHLENPIRLERINTQTRILSTPNNLTPIAHRAHARPQRRVRPQHGVERRGRLQTFGGVHVLEDFARYGEVEFHRLLVRWIIRKKRVGSCCWRGKGNGRTTDSREDLSREPSGPSALRAYIPPARRRPTLCRAHLGLFSAP